MGKVLLIEADKIIAGNLARKLAQAGYEVDWQVGPQAGIDSADSAPPDAVILDLLLAGRSGVEFLYEFRSYPEWQAVPVIIYSHVSEAELSASHPALAELGVRAFHYKPTATLDDLIQSLAAVAPAAARP